MKGFTLLELMISTIILSLLLALSISIISKVVNHQVQKLSLEESLNFIEWLNDQASQTAPAQLQYLSNHRNPFGLDRNVYPVFDQYRYQILETNLSDVHCLRFLIIDIYSNQFQWNYCRNF